MTTVVREVHFKNQGRRKRAVPGPRPAMTQVHGRIPRVSKLMALAIRFDRLLNDGTIATLSDLARLARVTQPRITQIMNLLHLAPDIQEELLFLQEVTAGRDPIHERMLRPLTAIEDWRQQRRLWHRLVSSAMDITTVDRT